MQMKLKFLEIDTSVKNKLNQIWSITNQCRCRKEPALDLKIGVSKKMWKMCRHIFCKHKRIKLLICWTTWKGVESSSNFWLHQRKVQHYFNEELVTISPR